MTGEHAGGVPAALEPALLRQAFATFATGVTVVTVGGRSPHGMTANAFTSVSLRPPLLLVCVDRSAVMHAALGRRDGFAVSVLSAGQEDLARHFANRRRPHGAAQFEAVRTRPGACTGAPLIEGALAHFECEVLQAYAGGDHDIFLGRLLSLERRDDDDALLFLHGRFHRIGNDRSEVPS